MKSNPTIGLALSGGGIRGVAHLGVLKALEERKIPVHQIAGVSAGSIVGALYASGYSADEILAMVKKISAFRLFQPALNFKGLLKIEVIKKFLREYIKVDDFSALKIPLTVGATNLTYGRTDYFYEGSLIDPICASSCVPVLFDPMLIGDQWYIDGGILNNLPAEPIRKSCDIVIGIHTNPVEEDFIAANARQVMERALMMAIGRNVDLSRQYCDHYLEPPGLGIYRVSDLSSADVIFTTGYYAMLDYLDNNPIL